MPDFPGAQEPSFGDPYVNSGRGARPAERHESGQNINTGQQVGAMAPKTNAGQGYEMAAEMGKQAMNIGLKFAAASDSAKASTAELEFKTGMDNILSAAANDTDPDNQGEYLNQIEKLRQKTTNKKFAFGESRDNTNAKLGYLANAGNVHVVSAFRTKIVDRGVANMTSLLDRDVTEGGEGMEESIKGRIQLAVDEGFIDRTAAQKLEKTYVASGRYNNFLRDNEADTELSGARLEKNEYGLSGVDLAKAKKARRATIAANEEAVEQAEVGLLSDLSSKLVDDSLGTNEVRDAVSLSGLDAEIGALMELAQVSPKEWKKATSGKKSLLDPKDVGIRANAFLNPLKESSTTAEGKKKVLKMALESFNKEEINKAELAFILRLSNGQSTDRENPIYGFAVATLETVAAADSNLPMLKGGALSMPIASALSKFITSWNQKDDPRPVGQKAIFDRYDEVNKETAWWEEGGTYWTPGGQVQVTGRDPNTGSWLVKGVHASDD